VSTLPAPPRRSIHHRITVVVPTQLQSPFNSTYIQNALVPTPHNAHLAPFPHNCNPCPVGRAIWLPRLRSLLRRQTLSRAVRRSRLYLLQCNAHCVLCWKRLCVSGCHVRGSVPWVLLYSPIPCSQLRKDVVVPKGRGVPADGRSFGVAYFYAAAVDCCVQCDCDSDCDSDCHGSQCEWRDSDSDSGAFGGSLGDWEGDCFHGWDSCRYYRCWVYHGLGPEEYRFDQKL